MKTKKTATLVAITQQPFIVQYDTLADLLHTIFFSFSMNVIDDAVITFSDGRSYKVDYDGMHYCFAKSRISVDELVDRQFSEAYAV